MDIRTFGHTQRTLRRDNSRLQAENERLTDELTLRLRQLMQASTDYGQLLTAHERLRHDLADAQTVAILQRELHAAELATANDNAAELSKALDMCIAERNEAFAEVDAHRRELAALRDERPRLLAANVRLFHDNNALRAELDAMRQAHSVIVGRMAAMGC